ncbi:Vms1/Ankzf1 family peptidyl-tRNA hydrolase [Halalkalirubrum salinum]|uniref:Vms1/Ankzf1 family peptidyl-tRNA hydrolase n=1 Tax=Halalkalirubrum salinum TaxID=2563889 RepID=UPI0010FB7AEF|nr:Vms1/Ankzf1 family peptidyl-tRNA hydrolase [Halalkalirubrum salinum]
MLDELFGRAELKAEIETLSEENRHLERRLEAEQKRRADAVSDKQDAEETINRLEDRLTALEDKLDRLASGGTETTVEFARRTSLRGDRLDEFLSRLRSIRTGPEGALTVTIDEGRSLPESATTAFEPRTPLLRRAAPGVAYADDMGLVTVVVRPPIQPDPVDQWDDSFLAPEEWFRPTGRFAFGVVRSDVFAVGVYEGVERQSVTGFESDVKSDHSKGGFSQGRFERIRDEQIADHLDAVREELDDVERVDRTILVGERTVLDDLEAAADHTAAVDARGSPQDALESAFRDFWTTRLSVI